MISRTTARSQIETTPYQAAQAALVAWGALMLSIYMIDLLVFPLTPTLYREDLVLEIEQMLRHGRKWFAPLYVLGLLTLFYALWRVLNTVHVLSKEDPGAAKSLRKWVLGIGVLAYLPVQHHSGAKHRDVLDRLALEQYWNFWTIMTVITTPWVFGIPLIGPLLLKWKNSRRFENSLWL